MKDKYLITNSDDFGMNESITDAIIDTHINGIMTSTTIMVNMPGFEYAVKQAKIYPTLGVGIHFNLTEGRPISPNSVVSSLIDENGFFLNNAEQRKKMLSSFANYKQARIELYAQLKRLLDYGIKPTHFDSHHHITGVPMAFKASVDVAKEFNILKARTTDINYRYSNLYRGTLFSKIKLEIKNKPKSFIHHWNKVKLHKAGIITPDTKILPYRVLPLQKNEIDQFILALSLLKEGITEISFHPGKDNANIFDSEKTSKIRARDYSIAKSKLVSDYIKDNNIKLISYNEL